ncbi:MAG: hypothetical protein H6696_02170 [Deferribacteres bacterium]|nr:hypothetical protein [candidate division KSB1 bacterium]MCB9500719.1 hypothetical protein [Deferribacteres bacterium]
MNESYRQKIAPSIIAIAIISIVFIAMHILTLPKKNIADIYRKFDESVWKQFEPPEIKKEEPKEEEPEKVEPEEIVEEKFVEQEIILDDIDQILQEELAILDDIPLDEPSVQELSDLGLNDLMDNEILQSSVDPLPGLGLDEFGDEDASLIPMSMGGDGGGGLKTIASKQGGSGMRGYAGGTGRGVTKVNRIKDKDTKIKLTARRNLSNLDIQNEVYRQLVQWLKKHHKDLSPVVKAFLEYNRGGLTTSERFTAGTRSFELYIMCMEKGTEVRIALVEGNAVTRLIDQGFTKRSDQLRVGKVTRDENGEIFIFDTKLQRTGSKENNEFYNIFLSWWDNVKDK